MHFDSIRDDFDTFEDYDQTEFVSFEEPERPKEPSKSDIRALGTRLLESVAPTDRSELKKLCDGFSHARSDLSNAEIFDTSKLTLSSYDPKTKLVTLQDQLGPDSKNQELTLSKLREKMSDTRGPNPWQLPKPRLRYGPKAH